MPFRRESHSFVISNRHYSLKTRIKRKFAVDVDFAKAVLLSSGYEALEYSIPMLDKNVRETGVAPDIIISAHCDGFYTVKLRMRWQDLFVNSSPD